MLAKPVLKIVDLFQIPKSCRYFYVYLPTPQY